MRTATFFLLLVSVLSSITLSQELSTEVYPSEDELLEALSVGVIDTSQYHALLEIIVHGIDSTNRHLLDEIPNLSFFFQQPQALTTALENEQQASFVKPVTFPDRRRSVLRYQYCQTMEEKPGTRYRASARVRFGNRWLASFRLHRERNGRERIVSRSVTYRNVRGILRELRLGNFSKRLGLGAAFGYRGRILSFAGDLSNETLLFPDYGGYNGLYGRLRSGHIQLEILSSLNRDSDHRLWSAAGMLSVTKGHFSPGVIIGLNRLSSRNTKKGLHDVKYAVVMRADYAHGYSSTEVCGQAGERSSVGGAVIEGRHFFGGAQIKYAGWAYSDRYLDLSGGSKAGNIGRTVLLEDLGFEFSDKRSGQKGGLIKTIVLLTNKVELVNSFLYAGRKRDTANVQLLSGLVKTFDSGFSVRLDYLTRTNRRVRPDMARNETTRRTRVETRLTAGNLTIRSYIGYNTGSDRADFLSGFVNIRYKSRQFARWELWSNLARFDPNDGVVDHWYMYVQNQRSLWDDLIAVVKFSHTYHRGSGNNHSTMISFELRMWI